MECFNPKVWRQLEQYEIIQEGDVHSFSSGKSYRKVRMQSQVQVNWRWLDVGERTAQGDQMGSSHRGYGNFRVTYWTETSGISVVYKPETWRRRWPETLEAQGADPVESITPEPVETIECGCGRHSFEVTADSNQAHREYLVSLGVEHANNNT